MRLLAVAVLLALFGACAGADQVTGDRRNVGVVTVVFAVRPARVRIGQPVRLTLRVSNNGGKTEKLTSPSGKVYDFWVKKRSHEVWRWSSGRAFVQTVTETGTYTAYGVLTASGFEGPMKGTVIIE